jgi:hypothetical protein
MKNAILALSVVAAVSLAVLPARANVTTVSLPCPRRSESRFQSTSCLRCWFSAPLASTISRQSSFRGIAEKSS